MLVGAVAQNPIKPEKIMFVMNIPSPYRAFFFSTLSRVLRDEGGELIVVYCASTEPDRDWEYVKHKHDYRHHIVRHSSPSMLGQPIHLNPSIASLVMCERPNKVIVGGSWHMPSGWIAHFCGRLLGAELIFWSESHADAVLNRKGLIPLVRRFGYRRYKRFCAPNRRSSDWIKEVYAGSPDIIALPNLVDESVFSTTASQLRKIESVNACYSLKLVQVSKLEDHKGVIPLVNAVLKLNRLKPLSVHLSLIGEGTQRAAIEALISKSSDPNAVRLFGNCTQQRVAEIICMSEVFVLNTRFDPNPISVIEALFCGMPIVITRACGNFAETLIPGENGLLCDDSENIELAIEEMLARRLSDGENFKRMGKRSREIAAQNFSAMAASVSLVRQLATLGDLTGDGAS